MYYYLGRKQRQPHVPLLHRLSGPFLYPSHTNLNRLSATIWDAVPASRPRWCWFR